MFIAEAVVLTLDKAWGEKAEHVVTQQNSYFCHVLE